MSYVPSTSFARRSAWTRTPSRSGLSRRGDGNSPAGRPDCLTQDGPAHAHGGNEVIGVDLQRLVAVADRIVIVAQGVMGISPLIPGLGKGRHAFDQVAGRAQDLVELPRGVEADDRVELRRSFSLAARVHTWRMLFSARIRTVRSSSSKAAPSVGLDS